MHALRQPLQHGAEARSSDVDRTGRRGPWRTPGVRCRGDAWGVVGESARGFGLAWRRGVHWRASKTLPQLTAHAHGHGRRWTRGSWWTRSSSAVARTLTSTPYEPPPTPPPPCPLLALCTPPPTERVRGSAGGTTTDPPQDTVPQSAARLPGAGPDCGAHPLSLGCCRGEVLEEPVLSGGLFVHDGMLLHPSTRVSVPSRHHEPPAPLQVPTDCWG